MNSIVRERAARRIYVAYMNIKYEYQSVVLAARCCPLSRLEEGTGPASRSLVPAWRVLPITLGL